MTYTTNISCNDPGLTRSGHFWLWQALMSQKILAGGDDITPFNAAAFKTSNKELRDRAVDEFNNAARYGFVDC